MNGAVAVVGAGLMGSQIACEYALGGHLVIVIARDPDRARARVEDAFATARRHAVATAENTANSARSEAMNIGQLAMRYAENNIASSFDFAQRLARAKDAQEVMQLHSDYVKQQMATLTEQARELSQKTAKMAGG